jgi:hypothetical protein
MAIDDLQIHPETSSASARTKDDVALDLMKFVAVTTGFGKGTGAAGFTGKTTKTPEEYAESLLQLFQRCRAVVEKGHAS